jgi:hypothetical protein
MGFLFVLGLMSNLKLPRRWGPKLLFDTDRHRRQRRRRQRPLSYELEATAFETNLELRCLATLIRDPAQVLPPILL